MVAYQLFKLKYICILLFWYNNKISKYIIMKGENANNKQYFYIPTSEYVGYIRVLILSK